MKFQVLSTDEYRQTSILSTFNELEDARKFLNKQLSNLNFENALTTDDKFKSIEAYGVEFLDNNGYPIMDTVYSGNTTDGRPRKLVNKNGSYTTEVVNSKEENIRILLGINENKNEPHYLRTAKNEAVDRLGHELLEGKTEFFIRVF